MNIRLLAVGGLAGLLLGANVAAASDDYPTKPIRLIVPYSAGGANDLVGRTFAEVAARALGQPIIVENRTGGAGLIGSTAVARAEPDGYTLMISGIPSLVLSPAMSPAPPFDTMKDFTHIAFLGGPPNVLVVNPSLGVKTFKEFAELATRSKDLQYLSPSVGSVGHLMAESMAERMKLNLTHVAYKGGGAAIFDLIAGHVKVGSMTLSTTHSHIKEGKLIPLAISTDKRLSELPEVPTMPELGLPDLVTATWYALSGPAGLPKPVVEKLNTEFNKAISSPSVQKVADLEALQMKAMSPEETAAYFQSEINKWTPLAKKAIAPR